jgi:hypothetical protein
MDAVAADRAVASVFIGEYAGFGRHDVQPGARVTLLISDSSHHSVAHIGKSVVHCARLEESFSRVFELVGTAEASAADVAVAIASPRPDRNVAAHACTSAEGVHFSFRRPRHGGVS